MDECLKERYELAVGRVREIREESTAAAPYLDFFRKTADFLCRVIETAAIDRSKCTLEELTSQNRALYEDVLPENYGESYGNPAYAKAQLGEYGADFSFLYTELQGAIVYAFEQRCWDLTVILELFLEVYSSFNQEELPTEKDFRGILRSYAEDYSQDMIEQRIQEILDPSRDFAAKIIEDSDLSDVRYLYEFGEYITENELAISRYLGSLPDEEIEAMARTFTEGFRMGFVNGRKDLSKKKTVNIRYSLGFERMIKVAISQFAEMGLQPVLYRHAIHSINKRGNGRIGYTGAIANKQYEYDHRQDWALFLDSEFSQKILRATQTSYEEYKELAAVHAGPAVMETFGETPFSPDATPEALKFSETQQKQKTDLTNELGQIVNRYIKGDERSFTIIAYPVPEIGEHFEEIFKDTIKINTLDYKKYQQIQQTMIDTLDTCEWVEVKGRGDNETDLLIHLHELKHPKRQTNFENCVADVNIPVGEVFTSPVLAGTGGVLHVSSVYLEGLKFENLRLTFDCGQVIDYSCDNFDDPEEGRKYIEDNILFHHPKIAMGEFAIGTNTTAYVMARKYGIEDKLPILIAEKTGPHFAVGDTCYSWEEDNKVYNPDGKEIIARDNEISEMRKEDVSLAYFGCHTDITIPYEELGSIRVIKDDGEMESIIENGRFVLPGTEELNEPLDKEC